MKEEHRNHSENNALTRAAPGERPGKVLVLDGEFESALAVVRSLGRRRIEVHVGSCVNHPIAAFSRYCVQSVRYPDPLVDISGFRAALRQWIEMGRYSLIVPVTDLTLLPLMEIRHAIEHICPIAMADNASLAVVQSKSRTYELARTCNVPIPRSLTIRDWDDFLRVKDALSYPVAIKPDQSKVWPAGKPGAHLTTAYGSCPGVLEAEARRLLSYGPVVLQELVTGEPVGIGVIASAGRILTSFQFRSLHEVPLSGGISSYRVSEPIDPVLLEHCSAMLGALGWQGVAHIEFIRDSVTHRCWLMEINGRFWASLPLATAAGADFPAYLFDLVVRGRTHIPGAYRSPVRCHLLGKELLWCKEIVSRFLKKKRGDSGPFPSLASFLADVIGILNPFALTDTLDPLDLRPMIHDRARFFLEAIKELMRRAG
ncbi:MAG: hypothetical protein AB9873_05720 [Syntrophobacteraceae bacterium]